MKNRRTGMPLLMGALTVSLSLFVLCSFSACRSKGPAKGPKCGGMHSLGCAVDAYCKMDESCGGIDRNGTCEARPTACSPNGEDVCGCDGVTYDSECYAAVKGISVRHMGSCSGTPAP